MQATSFTRTPMSKAIDAVTKMVTVLFNTPGSERPEHSLDVDLSSTLAELKEKISAGRVAQTWCSISL